MKIRRAVTALLLLAVAFAPVARAQDDVARLVGALLSGTPLVDDLHALADGIGGRPTGSEANLAAVEWGLARFRAAGVDARREGFQMPALWLERAGSATVQGEGVHSFAPRVAALPFSTATPAAGLSAPLVDAGHGTAEDFLRLAARARGAWVLVENDALRDIDGLFREYAEAVGIEQRTIAAGAVGLIYQGSRPDGVLYRHNAWLGPANRHPMMVMERTAAGRILRLLRDGHALTLTARLDLQAGGPYESYNVVGEIRGATRPNEIVVIGSHLDSWDIGTGTLDNGANATMMIDIARQIHRLGLRPARTVRFVLWNGEEQGLIGSWRYTAAHQDELDRTVMAGSVDIGTGRITGFFTGGRQDVVEAVERALEPVRGLGPFTEVNLPIVGTDNFDFMMEGVPNLVANQESANYGPNYHAGSDTFDKADLVQLRTNAAIMAALVWYFANTDTVLPRSSRAQIEQLVRSTDLADQMRTFGILQDWESGARGRRP
jgi:hypothetical protein